MAFTSNTQKATGILTLLQASWKMPKTEVIIAEVGLEIAWKRLAPYGGRLFARPCPVKPRHGFVDSRPVHSLAELTVVWNEARAADPMAEVVLMAEVVSTYNMTWRPGCLAVGTGNDGATGGHDSILVPLVAGCNPALLPIFEKAKIVAPDVPYIEAVMGVAGNTDEQPHVYYTQARGGPMVEGSSPDWIPSKMKVQYVVDAVGDLLEWEDAVSKMKPGTAVYHPGGNLASHYSVHCIQQWTKSKTCIPVLTTRKPKVGEVLAPAAPVKTPSPEAVVRGIAAGTVIPLNDEREWKHAVLAVLTGLHHSSAMTDEAGFYIGVAAVLMERLGLAAALGEARHSKKKSGLGIAHLNRSQVYAKVFADMFTAREKAGDVARLFFNGSWGGAFGGYPWGDCTLSIANLDAAIVTLVHEPTLPHVAEMIESLNFAVNLAHNNGWWMNKFIPISFFDMAAKLDPRAFIPAGPTFHRATRIATAHVNAMIARWRSCTVECVTVDGAWAGTEADNASYDSIHEMVKIVVDPKDATIAHTKLGGHIQWKTSDAHIYGYQKLDVVVTDEMKAAIEACPTDTSYSGSSTPYHILAVDKTVEGWTNFKAGNVVVAKLPHAVKK
jgi:hypothetical protein